MTARRGDGFNTCLCHSTCGCQLHLRRQRKARCGHHRRRYGRPRLRWRRQPDEHRLRRHHDRLPLRLGQPPHAEERQRGAWAIAGHHVGHQSELDCYFPDFSAVPSCLPLPTGSAVTQGMPSGLSPCRKSTNSSGSVSWSPIAARARGMPSRMVWRRGSASSWRPATAPSARRPEAVLR